ncbi:Swi3-domain-containing protein [Calocera cornea HHB12733]|uniref:Chromosome segregation in meiosis protein n=1 Tax=Calocera cornea HHB12733 TaxID=1353952 RepID=A0A165H7J3_9BASI|nr:Swi3-domain-containing protein [Calocera cornea HHB12733]
MVDVSPLPTTYDQEALDKLFASSDDEDAGPSILPDIDRAQVARDAQRKARESLNLPAAGTSTPPEATQSVTNGSGAAGTKRGREEDEEEPKRRVMAKIDAERLLGEYGFPALVQQTKNFKPKGKGHEKEDLDRVMTLYQLWAHRMFPKRRFIDTVERVERVCREKRMLVALSVWRDALNPNAPHNKEPVSEADIILSDGEDGSRQPAAATGTGEDDQPPTGATGRGDDDDSDNEEIWAEILSRMKSNNAASSAQAGDTAAPNTAKQQQEPLFAEDEDALWDEMMREEEGQAMKTTEPIKSAVQAENEDALWDEMMKEQEQEVAVLDLKQTAARVPEDDEDLMALMREADEQDATVVVAPAEKALEAAVAAPQGGDKETVLAAHVEEEDWERLYD